MTWVNRLTRTIQYGEHEVTLTVRGQSGMDHFIEISLVRRIYKLVTGNEFATGIDLLSPEVRAINELVEMINRTEEVKGLPGKWSGADSNDKALKAMFDMLSVLPHTVVKQWCDLIDDASKPPGDPDLFPKDKLSPEQLDNPEVEKKETA